MKMLKLNKKQISAIASVERAMKKLKEAKILICGMDGNILYVSQQAYEDTPESNKGYGKCATAYMYYEIESDAVGMIKTHGTYQDSGGW